MYSMERESVSTSIFPDEAIMSKIYVIRVKKVMLDLDLAALYGVETKYLKRQVRRNILRFPEDFMFELNVKEFEKWRSQFGTSHGQGTCFNLRPPGNNTSRGLCASRRICYIPKGFNGI